MTRAFVKVQVYREVLAQRWSKINKLILCLYLYVYIYIYLNLYIYVYESRCIKGVRNSLTLPALPLPQCNTVKPREIFSWSAIFLGVGDGGMEACEWTSFPRLGEMLTKRRCLAVTRGANFGRCLPNLQARASSQTWSWVPPLGRQKRISQP